MVMTEQEILVGLAEIVEEFTGVPASKVTLKSNLSDDLEIDSLSMIEIIVSVQDRFGVEIPDTDLKGLKMVQDVVSYVQRVQRLGVSA
jgi:acyl carrier protein